MFGGPDGSFSRSYFRHRETPITLDTLQQWHVVVSDEQRHNMLEARKSKDPIRLKAVCGAGVRRDTRSR